MEIKKIFEDEREIESIHGEFGHYHINQQFTHASGNLIEKIIAYKEYGPLGFVPFLAVYLNGEIKFRINAANASIFYKEN